jgi:hypothetical protein
VLGQHPALGVLVMNLPPSEYRPWKRSLRDGLVDLSMARAVGTVLARIHNLSAASPQLAQQFATAIFFDIRLEPYLLATAQRHPRLAAELEQLVVTRTHTVTLGDAFASRPLSEPALPVKGGRLVLLGPHDTQAGRSAGDRLRHAATRQGQRGSRTGRGRLACVTHVRPQTRTRGCYGRKTPRFHASTPSFRVLPGPIALKTMMVL